MSIVHQIPGRAPLHHETCEMQRRFKRLGTLAGGGWSLDDYNNAIEWWESTVPHDELPAVYDAIVAARNALQN